MPAQIADRLTPTMIEALEIAASNEHGTVIPIGDGFWVAGGTPRELRDNLLTGVLSPRPKWVRSRAVNDCERAGLFERIDNGFARHVHPHRITDAGRARLADLRTANATNKKESNAP